jgi:UDP-N-acetylglucosamine--N-acetylmuramyl-(pentapeptide) pyrophosphoryl-undecaprenol N-acetylglucosamine transferase
MSNSIHIIFAGGGTGGHLFPGIAVAEELLRREPSARVTFCGSGRDWEREQVARAGYDYLAHTAAPLVGSPMGVLRAIYANGVGYRRARRTVIQHRPQVVVGLGGYGSVPIGLAAARLGVPLVLLEQNLIPGRANALLSRWAALVCLAFEVDANRLRSGVRAVVTGNPVRSSILELAAAADAQPPADRTGQPTLLVFGGSQGAHSVNRVVAQSLPRIAEHMTGWRVIHQAGAKDGEWLRGAYVAAGVSADIRPFIHDMADAYAQASLAICRAGATTLAELATVGVPAILLPYPLAAANHQWHNAQFFGRAGAAVVIEDRPDTAHVAATLTSSLLPLIKLPALRDEMRRATRQLARPTAASIIVDELLALAGAAAGSLQSA